MLVYLRLYTFVCFLAVMAVAGVLGYYLQGRVEGEVLNLGQKANVALARHFNAEIWARHGEALKRGETTQAFKTDMERFMYNAQAYALRIYTPDGALVYTTGGTLSAPEFTAEVARALANPARVASDFTLSASENLPAPAEGGVATLARSLVPLGEQGNGGVVELFTDVTREQNNFWLFGWLVLGGMVALFLLLLLALYLLYYRVEALVASQHERTMELERTVADAQEETQQKSLFLANISHELRTPLNAIIGFSDIIRSEMMGDIKNPQFAGYINDINSSGVHLLSLINDILDFSKADAGKLELEVEEVNASKLASNCLRLVQPRAEAAGIELVSAMPKEAFVLETDAKKLKQIFLNLMSNAVKFTPSGGKVKVTGWHDIGEDVYVFQVSDTGIGIAQKDIAKAMAPFGQVDSALSKKYEGTGLGLPLTRKFIELMGGKFGMQSELNIGTTITFSLPRVFKPGDGIIFKRVGE